MDVDASLTLLGGFGLVQTLNFLAYVICSGSTAWHLTGVSFTIGEPEGYRCSLPPNATDDGDDWGYIAGKCEVVYTSGEGNETLPCDDGWEYQTLHGETSVVTDLNLVCDRAILAGTLTSIHFGGALAGSFILGQLSDIFGRRPVVLGSLAGIAITGTALSFSWDYVLMVVLRFLYGCFIPGLLTVSYVRQIEMFTPGRRVRGQVMSEMAWVVGILLLGPMAFLIPNWRHLQLTISLSSLPLIPLVWFSFESVRWLVQKGRVEEAEKILQRIAKSKNISHSGYFLLNQQDPDLHNASKTAYQVSLELETKAALGNPPDGSEEAKEADDDSDGDAGVYQPMATPRKKKKVTLLDLFKTPALIMRTLFVFYCWFASSTVYYGFFINAGNLVGNKYLNFVLIAITEAPCYILNFFIMTRLGRRRPLITYYLVGGAACILTGAIPVKTANGSDMTVVIVVVAMIGKFFASAAFDILYLVTAELYPTVLRNAAVGAANVVGRAGGMVAPFIVYLSVYHKSIPMIVFGVVSLVAGILVIPLPETNNRSLPETLEDELTNPTKEENVNEVTPADV